MVDEVVIYMIVRSRETHCAPTIFYKNWCQIVALLLDTYHAYVPYIDATESIMTLFVLIYHNQIIAHSATICLQSKFIVNHPDKPNVILNLNVDAGSTLKQQVFSIHFSDGLVLYVTVRYPVWCYNHLHVSAKRVTTTIKSF